MTLGGAGGVGLAAEAFEDSVELIFAAAVSAAAASTVPNPDPVRWPPLEWNPVLVISAFFTCAGLMAGNCALISAATPATTALAAKVLFTLAYPAGPVAAMTPLPGPVSVT